MVNVQQLENGLTLACLQVPEISSAAYSLIFGSGLSADPETDIGASLALADLSGRRAGEYDQREFNSLFQSNGISHSESAKLDQFSYQGTCLSEKLEQAIELLSLVFSDPRYTDEELKKVKQSIQQDILSVNDYPFKKVIEEFNARFFPSPYNRPSVGSADGVEHTDVSVLDSVKKAQMSLNGAVLAIVSNQSSDQVADIVQKHFSSITGEEVSKPEWTGLPEPFSQHIHFDSAQVQIVMAFQAAKLFDQDYYVARVLNGVLSGGMCGRLFSEVREKKGLCYSVSSGYSAKEDYGRFLCYAGTTSERAHETLSVIREVLNTLKGTITEEELHRSKTDLISGMIISRETSAAKAAAFASDLSSFKRIRSIEEITEALEKVTLEDLDRYLDSYQLEEGSLLTLGSQEICQ